MTIPGTQVAEINLQPSRAKDYSVYVPVWLGSLTTAAFINSGNTFANVISPQTMVALGISLSQLEIGTATLRGDRRCWQEDEDFGPGTPHRPSARGTPCKVLHPPAHTPRTSPPRQHLWPFSCAGRHRSDTLQRCPEGLWERSSDVSTLAARTDLRTPATATFPWGLHSPCVRSPGSASPIHTQRPAG